LGNKRATNVNLDLKDPEWDKLFDGGETTKSSKKRDFEMSYGDVVQKAKEVASQAHLGHHNVPRKSRKSDIFRSREDSNGIQRRPDAYEKPSGGMVSFLRDNAQYLCFAAPIGDGVCGGGQDSSVKTPDISPAANIEPNLSEGGDVSASGTVHTETSTQYFDRKHGISKSSAQPMPLFSEFRIDCLDWSANDEEADADEGADTEDLGKQKRLLNEFEQKVKAAPSRKEQIESTFSAKTDPAMPDVLRLSGSHSTLELDSRSRSSSSRSSQRKQQQSPSPIHTPQRKSSIRRRSFLRKSPVN